MPAAPWRPILALAKGVSGEVQMDSDRIAGAAKQVKGSIKEAIGKLTGDTKAQAEGAAEKVEGKVQNTTGCAKDAVRGTADK
jgi:uncharacterized protein YjbJ (UPF0337 family)